MLGAITPVRALLLGLLLLGLLSRRGLRRGIVSARGERDGRHGEGAGGENYGESCTSHEGQPGRAPVSSG